MSESGNFTLTCPIPIRDYPQVVLAHGGGGRLMHDLIEKMFVASFGSAPASERHDGAILEPPAGARLAFTTDSYVVRPLFFPGGDIATLAVNGTVNDLAMCGARPKWLSVGFILEEGLPMETLWRVVQSLAQAARAAEVQIVTGDTKVVDRGKGDGVFINTAGVGIVEAPRPIGPGAVREGDAIIVNGDLGRHGIAIMAVREGLEFETQIQSDCAPLWGAVEALLREGIEVHCLRDLTRGGLASALNEIAESAGVHIHVNEEMVPVTPEVRAACELLGFDPLYVANEGRFVAFVPEAHADRAVQALQRLPVAANATVVGKVLSAAGEGRVTLRSVIGATRILDMLSGEQLPRIC